MAGKPKSIERTSLSYRGANIPMRVIRKFARDVAEQFQPEKIVLFGSYAYGTPHKDSDVDILVIMPCRNELDQAVKIHWGLMPPFPLDIIVRKPKEMEWRLAEGESFTTEITTRGKVLYEKVGARVGKQGRSRQNRRDSTLQGKKSIA
jgi:predicted nucleotidyltransferase